MSTRTKVLIGVGVLVALAAVWWFFLRAKPVVTPATTGANRTTGSWLTQLPGGQFIAQALNEVVSTPVGFSVPATGPVSSTRRGVGAF